MKAEAREIQTFRDLGVLPETAEALEAVGITHPFPIQEMTLPIAMAGSDVIGQAKTGTGKTLGFGIPLVERVVTPRDPEFHEMTAPGRPQGLVIVPTRELAVQVTGDIETIGTRRGVRVTTLYGGRSYEPQVEALARGVEIVVGTPGRLLDLARQRTLDLSHVKILVLDEADEMLDLGFLPDVERLVALTPELRQTMLFSATMPGEVVALARRYMRQPTHIRAVSEGEGATVEATTQHAYRAHPLDKPEMLARMLQAEGRGLSIVFTRTKRLAQKVADDLADRGFAAGAVHGDLGQGAREQALRAFRNGKVDVLVATDVAARGIDVEGVTHVVNYQCPEDDKAYVHRIGRTGRAGAAGVAVTFVDWEDLARWASIDKVLGLGIGEPPETYSTSEHLLADLGIPADATGVLPRARRTRAGLGAEALEDLGESRTGRGRRQPSRSTPESRPSRARRRDRVRTRSGRPISAAAEGTTPRPAGADDHASEPVAEGEARPRRRRRRTRVSASTQPTPASASASASGD